MSRRCRYARRLSKPTPSWLQDDNNRILLATLTAIALAAGSTILWHTRRAEEPTATHSGLNVSSGGKSRENDNMNQQSSQRITAEAGGTTKASKSSRSKERRRRGKDLVKEMAKADNSTAKKTKKQKQSALKFQDEAAAQTAVIVPKIIEPEVNLELTPQVSVDESTTSSSGSRSSSLSVANDNSLLDFSGTATADPDLGEEHAILFSTTITSSVSAPNGDHPQHEDIRTSHSDSIRLAHSHTVLSSDFASSSSSLPSSSSSSGIATF